MSDVMLVAKRMGGRDVVYHKLSRAYGDPVSQCGAFWYRFGDVIEVAEAERLGVRPCLRCFPESRR